MIINHYFTYFRNMRPNHKELTEILITLSEDEMDEVSTAATAALNEIRKKYTEGNNAIRPIIEELEESFYTLLTKLPRIMRTGGELIIYGLRNITKRI